jgi:lysophospholipase L1-like esterase
LYMKGDKIRAGVGREAGKFIIVVISIAALVAAMFVMPHNARAQELPITLEQPVIYSTQEGENHNSFSWSAVDGAAKYRVYRKIICSDAEARRLVSRREQQLRKKLQEKKAREAAEHPEGREYAEDKVTYRDFMDDVSEEEIMSLGPVDNKKNEEEKAEDKGTDDGENADGQKEEEKPQMSTRERNRRIRIIARRKAAAERARLREERREQEKKELRKEERHLQKRARKVIEWNRICTRMGSENTHCADREAEPIYAYRYRVRAVNRSGQSLPSEEVVLQSKIETPVITGIRDNTLYWHPSDYAWSYRVYEKKKADDRKWKKLGETGDTSMGINFHKDYYYTVRALRGDMISDFDSDFSYRDHNYKNMKVLFEGASTVSPYYSWAERSATLMGFRYDNRAIEKSTVASQDDPGKSIYDRGREMHYYGYDVVVICVGANDYGKDMPLGSVQNTDPYTYCGALNAMILQIRTESPRADIVLTVPQERKKSGDNLNVYGYNQKNGRGNTLQDYHDATTRIAANNGCYLFDTRIGVVTSKNVEQMTSDHIHPVRAMHRKYGDAFVKMMTDELIPRRQGAAAIRKLQQRSDLKRTSGAKGHLPIDR